MIISIGPHHPIHQQPAVCRFKVEDETVVGIDFELGYNHRGIEKASEEKSFDQATFLVERICGVSPVAHALAYSNAVEDILGIEPPERSLYIRTIAAEAERMHSHLLWLGLICRFMARERLFARIEEYRRPISVVFQALTDKPVGYEIVKPGGVRQDMTDKAASAISKIISDLAPALDRLKKDITSDVFIKARTKGIGRFSKKDASAYAAVGPVARASGIGIDSRKSNPYAVYDRIKWRLAHHSQGDIFARMDVRLTELVESVEIIKQCLKKMTKGPIDVNIKEVTAGEGIGTAEAASGECVHFVRSDGANAPVRHKIRAAGYMNLPAIRSIIIGSQLSDAGIILASLDPCYCCIER
jgi:NADH-quinone oxidoreductase subunit D